MRYLFIAPMHSVQDIKCHPLAVESHGFVKNQSHVTPFDGICNHIGHP